MARRNSEDNPCRRHRHCVHDHAQKPEGSKASLCRLDALKAKAGYCQEPLSGSPLGVQFPPPFARRAWIQLGPTAVPGGQSQTRKPVIVTGRVTAIAVDPTSPQTLYVGAAHGGVWKSTDGGRMWTPMSDYEASLAIGALAIAPSNPSRLYAGTGEGNVYYYVQTDPLNSLNDDFHGVGVLRSDDGGRSWIHCAEELAGECFYRIVVHPENPDIAFAATSAGVVRTVDGGRTWPEMGRGLPCRSKTFFAATDVLLHPSAPGVAFAAFWNHGIYVSRNAGSATPDWSPINGGLPPVRSIGRIALAVARHAPGTLFALITNEQDDDLAGLYKWVRPSWKRIPLGRRPELYGAYTLNLAVDPRRSDRLYISGLSLSRATRDARSGQWRVQDIGKPIHSDHHAIAFDPNDSRALYAGTDGGIYKSGDGGATWDDRINAGLCITEFEFIDQHPTSSAVVFGGTQDTGTLQFRNSPAFYQAAFGDGGAVVVDQAEPRNVIHVYTDTEVYRSMAGGDLKHWRSAKRGLGGQSTPSLFYPPLALDPTDSTNLAFGANFIYLDNAQGANGWRTRVKLPGMKGLVSALHYVDANLIFAGTSEGEVYRAAKENGRWRAKRIGQGLPARWIWDIAALSADRFTVIVGMAGYGTPHVWRGSIAGNGASASWTAINGSARPLPDVPVNALAVDPKRPGTIYAGTEIGMFRTTDMGESWHLYDDGLPHTAIYDIKLHNHGCLIRAATHGRGLWERDLTRNVAPDSRVFLRDNIMDAGHGFTPTGPVRAAFADPGNGVTLDEALWWWDCADIKVHPEGDDGSFQTNPAGVDYIDFETMLAHRNPRPGKLHRIYVQVHNRGTQPAAHVVVRLLCCAGNVRLPDLPSGFWTAFPDPLAVETPWQAIGGAQTIASVPATEPAVVHWEWTPPPGGPRHYALLAIVAADSDPVPERQKVLSIGGMIRMGKHAGIKNVSVSRDRSESLGLPSGKHADLEFHFDRQTMGRFALALPSALQASLATSGFVERGWRTTERSMLKRIAGAAALQEFAHALVPSEATCRLNYNAGTPRDAFLLFRPSKRISGAWMTVTENVEGHAVSGISYRFTGGT